MVEAVEAIRRQIVVQAPQQRAFEVFTGEMTSWWPAQHHIGSAPIEEILIEPREGGRWYTRHTDGSETSTGYVAAWEPYDRVIVTWQIGADWKYDPKLVTSVELRFVAEGPDRTRVELEHRDLENFGPEAERMRAVFSEPGAWDGTLAAFAGAFDG
jgi:Activator of Hsp90 ATPase homolog 1-like protein